MKYTLITLAALSGTAFAQTIVNGDFSDTSGMTMKTDSGGTYYLGVPNGWASDNGNVPLDVPTPAYAGGGASFTSNFIDIMGTATEPVTVSQEVSGFTVGEQYTLSYDWGNYYATPFDMTISMGNGSDNHKGTGVVVASNNSFTFTASAEIETLSIAYNHTNGDSKTGFNSTNFTVTPVNPVPEPSSAALLGLGGLCFQFMWKPVPSPRGGLL